MAIVFLDSQVAVCGQLAPKDLASVAAQGFRVVVNNRPDGEAWLGQPAHRALDQAATAVGISRRVTCR